MQLIEVWRSPEDFERNEREIVQPVVAELLGGTTPPRVDAVPFEVRGLVPSGGVTI